MKKIAFIVLAAAMTVACGNKTKESEQARLDSIAEVQKADSIMMVEKAQATADSLRVVDSIRVADSIAAAQKVATKAVKKTAPAKKVVKKVEEETKSKVNSVSQEAIDQLEKRPVKLEQQRPENKKITLDEARKQAKEKQVQERVNRLGVKE